MKTNDQFLGRRIKMSLSGAERELGSLAGREEAPVLSLATLKVLLRGWMQPALIRPLEPAGLSCPLLWLEKLMCREGKGSTRFALDDQWPHVRRSQDKVPKCHTSSSCLVPAPAAPHLGNGRWTPGLDEPTSQTALEVGEG